MNHRGQDKERVITPTNGDQARLEQKNGEMMDEGHHHGSNGSSLR